MEGKLKAEPIIARQGWRMSQITREEVRHEDATEFFEWLASCWSGNAVRSMEMNFILYDFVAIKTT